jgi:hypothetical protein
MAPRDSHLGLRWPSADEVEIRAGEDRTGLGLHEKLGHIARRQPARVIGHDRRHVGGFALDGNLPGPRQRPLRRGVGGVSTATSTPCSRPWMCASGSPSSSMTGAPPSASTGPTATARPSRGSRIMEAIVRPWDHWDQLGPGFRSVQQALRSEGRRILGREMAYLEVGEGDPIVLSGATCCRTCCTAIPPRRTRRPSSLVGLGKWPSGARRSDTSWGHCQAACRSRPMPIRSGAMQRPSGCRPARR